MSILGIDVGTTGVKGIVAGESEKIITSDYKTYNLYHQKPGWVEYNTNEKLDIIFDLIRTINYNEHVQRDPITSLSISTIGESFTLIDEYGKILYNTIYTTDTRSIKEFNYLLSQMSSKEFFNITGYIPSVCAPLNKIIWLKKNKPNAYKNTKKILFTEDLLHYKLGVKNTKINYSLCCTSMFFDIRSKKWSKEILNKFDIDTGLFSTPVPSGIEIGVVEKKIAEDLGFKKKVSIISGGHDQQCAALGVGAVNKGISADSMGTVECITTVLEDLVTNDLMYTNNLTIRTHVIDGKYVNFVDVLSSGSVIKWYIDNFFEKESKKNCDIYKYIYSKCNFEPSYVLTLPYFSSSGTPYFDPEPKGAIIGLKLSDDKYVAFKSLIEGLIFEIALNIEVAEKAGIIITELRAVGKGANSDYWLKLKASITGKKIVRMKNIESSCMGAVMLAGIGINKFALEEAISKFVKTGKEFFPDEKIKDNYISEFEKYKKVYRSVKKIYDDN